MDFGEDRHYNVQANNEKFVLTQLGNVEHWVHVSRYTDQHINEPKFWKITWEAEDYPGYQANKKMGYNWSYLNSFLERANQLQSSRDSLDVYTVKVQNVEEMVVEST